MPEHDPGGKVRLALQPGVRGDACFGGASNEYRHWLSRCWGDPAAPYVLFIGMNLSTAEHTVDDPTIRKELEFSRRWGYTQYFKCNIMDYRSTSPRMLTNTFVRACSGQNLSTIRDLASRAGLIVMCYGRIHKSLHRYADETLAELRDYELWCFGTNDDGSPCHPLYLSFSTPLQRFQP